jgi:hypothetical protein
VPEFGAFVAAVGKLCDIKSQQAPLRQRLSLLESFVAESSKNRDLLDVSMLGPGMLVVADLTDPLLAREEANGIFQVLTEQFRTASIADVGGGFAFCSKVLALDEAHKFMDGDRPTPSWTRPG